ncbi:MAG: hypothetical protein ABIV26_05630 [Candidatus Limnocylindrales bacterium]
MIRSILARVVDRGAITAAFVGIGMALTIGVSFLLVIPVEPVYWLLSIPAGLLVGYYADARSGRQRGEWSRILSNAIFAGLTTGLTLAVLLIGVKALFFAADDGYRDPGLGGRISCQTGADCVFHRYLENQPEVLAAGGVADAATFSAYYWSQQLSTAKLLVLLATGFGLAGGALFGLTRSDPARMRSAMAAGQPGPADPAVPEAEPEAAPGAELEAAPGAELEAAPEVQPDDLQALSDSLLAMAIRFLAQQPGFLPFAATVSRDGTVAMVGGMPDGDGGDAAAIRSLLVGGLRAEAASGQVRAAGICADSTFRPEGGQPADAISMTLEHGDGEVLALVVPYRRDSGGEAIVGDVVRVEPGPPEVFLVAG